MPLELADKQPLELSDLGREKNAEWRKNLAEQDRLQSTDQITKYVDHAMLVEDSNALLRQAQEARNRGEYHKSAELHAEGLALREKAETTSLKAETVRTQHGFGDFIQRKIEFSVSPLSLILIVFFAFFVIKKIIDKK